MNATSEKFRVYRCWHRDGHRSLVAVPLDSTDPVEAARKKAEQNATEYSSDIYFASERLHRRYIEVKTLEEAP